LMSDWGIADCWIGATGFSILSTITQPLFEDEI
jgi:hypothetical protein